MINEQHLCCNVNTGGFFYAQELISGNHFHDNYGYRDGLCDEIFFYDNENGFVEVGQYRSGEMMLRANAPAWLDELRVRYNERLNDISRDK